MCFDMIFCCLSTCFEVKGQGQFKVKVQGQRSRSKIRLRFHVSTGAEWSIMVLGFDKYSKKSNETQIRYTLKNIIECSSQGAFKMVAYLICCCFDRLRHRGRSRF